MEKKMINEQAIKHFWEWFTTIQNILRENLNNPDVLNQLDDRVIDLGDFSWELGLGHRSTFQFTISPNGDTTLLEATKRIISFAPNLNEWEFHYAKQPRQSNLKFIMHADVGETIIDASDWKYVLLKFPEGTYDIIVKANNLKELPDADKYMAVEIALDGIIGEEQRLRLIEEIEIVEKFDPEYMNKATSFADFLNHLRHSFRND